MSEPYNPTAPAPKDFTLAKALQSTTSADGHYHCGKLDFPNRADYLSFSAAQTAVGGTPEQLAILHELETTGKIPRREEVNPAPNGTTIDGLLDLKGQKPDAKGFYHLGNMQVKEAEFDRFAALQREKCKSPEGLALLYHMENASGKALTYRVTGDEDRGDRYEPGSNTITVSDTTMVRDAFSHTAVPIAAAAIHEEGHWAGRAGISTLQGIPAGNWENMEEKREIEGVESRYMASHKFPQRHSHYGWALPTRGLESLKPELSVQENGVTREAGAPFSVAGKIGESKDGLTTIAVPASADGKTPAHDVKMKTEELSLAMGQDLGNAQKLLADAKAHGDTAQFQITNDGRLLYDNAAQQTRLQTHPQPGIVFPDAMQAVRPLREATSMGVSR